MIMDKILEALKKMLPENQINEVADAIKGMLKQAKVDVEKEYNSRLEEAYSELAKELTEAEKTAENGYEEAYRIIGDLRGRLDIQGQEYQSALEEGYEEAYQMLKSEREKGGKIEVDMYEEYDNKLNQMKSYIVDKVDEFLQLKGSEIYEQARRDVLSDPRLAEHKVTLDKIINITSDYISDDNMNAISGKKLEEAQKTLDEQKGQIKILEARSIRLSTENTKLNESVRYAQDVINEQKKFAVNSRKENMISEQKERTQKAKNVTGRGQTSTEEIVTENAHTPSHDMEQLLILSGVKKAR
jgi:hypothetical protein